MAQLSKSLFMKGFAKKSFLGSAYPSLRASAPRLDKKMGTNVSAQFNNLPKSKGNLRIKTMY